MATKFNGNFNVEELDHSDVKSWSQTQNTSNTKLKNRRLNPKVMAAQVYGVQPLAKIRKTQPPKIGGAFDFKSEIKHRDASPFGSVTAAVRI